MESNQPEEYSKSSSEETDRFEQGNDHEMGTGRSYECVFCKRGFTTAQALGGHMNIHRKERSSKPRPASSVSNSSKNDEDFSSFKSYPPIQSYYPTTTYNQEVHINYQTFFPLSSSSSWSVRHAQYSDHVYDQNLNLIGEDWRRNGLSLQIGSPSRIDDQEKIDGSDEGDELDLELRLGHHDP